MLTLNSGYIYVRVWGKDNIIKCVEGAKFRVERVGR